MKKLLQIWKESFLFTIFSFISARLLSTVKTAVLTSFLWQCKTWINRYIIESRPVQYLIDPTHLTNAWYSSAFYTGITHGLRRLGNMIPQPLLPWNSFFPGLFLTAMLFIPYTIWSDTFATTSFFLLSLFYFAHHAQNRSGIAFALVSLILLFFWGLLVLAVPYQAARSMTSLLLGISFFFLISFSVRSEKDFNSILACFYLLLCTLCALGLLLRFPYTFPAHATLKDGVSFGEVILLLFPFAFIFPLTFSSKSRRALYIILLLLQAFTTITATQSKAAFIGFSVELLLLVLFLDFRYLPFLLFLGPVMTRTALTNLSQMWQHSGGYGNFFANLAAAFRNFWLNGFGVNRDVFLDIYHSTAFSAQAQDWLPDVAHISISPVYFTLLLDAGALILVVFLTYILRLAHSALTSLFTAPKKYKIYFAAGFATLIGISVSSMLESTLFAPRTLLLYWGTLGMLRAARKIRFEIDSPLEKNT